MARKNVFGMLIVLLALIIALPAGAQGNQETALGEDYLVTLPDNWDVEEREGIFAISQDDMRIIVVVPEKLAEIVMLSSSDDAISVIIKTFVVLEGRNVQRRDIDQETIDGRETAIYEWASVADAESGLTMVQEMAGGVFALTEFEAPTSEYDDNVTAARAIMTSLQPKLGRLSGVPAAPCAVRARYDTVDLRVGPGSHRGVYTTMPAGEFIPVLGKATSDDDSQWWRLDTDTGSANELWVADADVETQGGCAQVRDVNAPPVISGGASADTPDTPSGDAPQPAPAAPGRTVQCPIRNASLFTIKGTLTGPGGQYYFEVASGQTVYLTVVPGNYDTHFFCDGCGMAGATNVWTCNGYTSIYIEVY